MSRHLRTALFSLIAGAVATSAMAGGQLTDLLRDRQSKIDALMQESAAAMTPELKRRLEESLAELLDFEEMGRQALGKSNWGKRAEKERAAFVAAFERLLRASSVRDPDIYRGKEVEYVEESLDGDSGTGTVQTRVSSKDAVTEVAYDFKRAGDGWAIVDYAIDGVSTVRNYRRQFRKLLREKGWDGLLARLTERAEKLERGEHDDADSDAGAAGEDES